MLNIPAPELARTLDRTGRWMKKWEVRRRNDVEWTDVSAYVVGDSVPIGTPDSPAFDFTVRFAREPGADSLAPGISASDWNRDTEDLFRPLLPPRSYIRGWAANLVKTAGDETAVWRLLAEGEIEVVEWPGREVVCQCKTWDGVLERAWIEDKEERGGETEEERPEMEDELQALIYRWPPALTEALQVLHVPVSPEHALGLYAPEGSLGAQLRTMAQEIGWDVRFAPDPDTGSRELTLYEPPRDKTVPDLALAGSVVERVPGLKEDPTHLRNDFKLTGQDADGREFTIRRTNALSINGGTGYGDGYGKVHMGIVDPKVTTVAQGEALLAYADNDLSRPLAELRIRVPYCPWIREYDLLEIGPMAGKYDFSTVWGVVGGVHEDEGSEKSSELELHGGGVVGQYHAWHARRGTIPSPRLDFYAIRVQVLTAESTDAHWAVQVEAGAGVEAIYDAYLVQTDETDSGEAWDAVRDAVDVRTTDTSVPYIAFIPKSKEGEVAYYRAEGRYTEPGTMRMVVDELRGAWQRPFYGTPAPLSAILSIIENATGTQFTAQVEVTEDPRGALSHVDFFVTRPGEVEAGPHTVPLLDGTALFGPEPLPQKPHIAMVRAVAQRNDGGEPLRLGPVPVDSDKDATTGPHSIAYANGTASIITEHDSDTMLGADAGEYRVDGGAPVTLTVSGDRRARFSVPQSTTAIRLVEVRAKNAAGEWAPAWYEIEVSRYEPPAPPAPALANPQPPPSVFDTGSMNDWEVAWAVNGSVTDADHEIEVTLYNGLSSADNLGPFAPSDGEWIGSVSGGDGVSSPHKALIRLIRIADGAVIDARFTPEVMSAT
jgi:hypothetical protein